VLAQTKVFEGLAREGLDRVCDALQAKLIPAGAYAVRQGDRGDSLFVILEGRVDVLLERHPGEEVALQSLGTGAIVGELALVLGGPRAASVRASVDTWVLELARAKFDELVGRHPHVLEPVSALLRERVRRLALAKHLRDLFGDDGEALAALERELSWVHLPSGQVLFHQGDDADGAYIVAAGRVRVAVNDASGERVVDEVGPGQWLGEMALLAQRPRSATAYASRDTDLIRLSKAAFERVLADRPRAWLETSRLLVTRLERQMRGVARRREMTTFTVLPTSVHLGVTELVRDLVAELSRGGPVATLTADVVDEQLGVPGIAQLGPDDPGHFRLASWLMEQEATHRFVVYRADDTWSQWTDRAVRHADAILIVADAESTPAISEVERRLEDRFATGRAPRRHLVLVHSQDATAFHGTTRFTSARPIERHFHVTRGSRTDVARLARHLSGRPVGLVFGGGGSRGFAHAGVLRAFEELGIPVDAVGGTSVGALLGVAAALGMTARQILETCGPALARCLRPTIPITSLMSARPLVDGMERVVQGMEIEDLRVPFFCVSTSLTRGGAVVHRSGPIIEAVLASGAVPGIWPPVARDGELLVDGGLSDNVPVGVMASLIGGAIVAVDVIPEIDLGAAPKPATGWKTALRTLNPLAGRATPNILSILMRSVTTANAGMRVETATELASLYLRPELDRWNMLDFSAAEVVAEQGYRTTVHTIARWWEQHLQ
jgi:predicted acylesterase/phospholipase RssA/CRP-like cAMP-binding protein